MLWSLIVRPASVRPINNGTGCTSKMHWPLIKPIWWTKLLQMSNLTLAQMSRSSWTTLLQLWKLIGLCKVQYICILAVFYVVPEDIQRSKQHQFRLRVKAHGILVIYHQNERIEWVLAWRLGRSEVLLAWRLAALHLSRSRTAQAKTTIVHSFIPCPCRGGGGGIMIDPQATGCNKSPPACKAGISRRLSSLPVQQHCCSIYAAKV